jgi:peptidoglycan hydrolase CwlO-like protein
MEVILEEIVEKMIERNRLNSVENNDGAILNSFNEHLAKFDKEIKDMKDSINTLNSKISSFMNETNEKFLDFEAALVEIENNNNCVEEVIDNLENDHVNIVDNLENNTIVDDSVENIEETN